MLQQKDKYTYYITWSKDDNEYVGLCAKFPSLSWLADSSKNSLQGIRNLVAEVLLDMANNAETISEPIATKNFR